MELWMIVPIVLTIIVFIFWSWVMHRIGFIKGYRSGAAFVLADWKKSLYSEEENNNDQIL